MTFRNVLRAAPMFIVVATATSCTATPDDGYSDAWASSELTLGVSSSLEQYTSPAPARSVRVIATLKRPDGRPVRLGDSDTLVVRAGPSEEVMRMTGDITSSDGGVPDVGRFEVQLRREGKTVASAEFASPASQIVAPREITKGERIQVDLDPKPALERALPNDLSRLSRQSVCVSCGVSLGCVDIATLPSAIDTSGASANVERCDLVAELEVTPQTLSSRGFAGASATQRRRLVASVAVTN
jgi:hypothetical protein